MSSILAWAHLFLHITCLVSSVLAQTPTPAPTATSSTTTPSPASTPSPSTPVPTTLAPSPSPTPSPESSSSSSDNDRGATIAWALFTVALCITLLILLYNREKGNQRRIYPGGSLRHPLTSADNVPPGGYDGSPDDGDPAMSSF